MDTDLQNGRFTNLFLLNHDIFYENPSRLHQEIQTT